MLTQFQPYAETSGLSNLEEAGCGNSRSNLCQRNIAFTFIDPVMSVKAWPR
jgi:hypothetical protein